MSKKSIKLVSIVTTIAMILMLSTSAVFATSIGGVDINPNTTTNGAANVTKVGNSILGIIQVVGTVVAIGILMILGIKYMVGSAEEKAAYKKTMMPYIIGAVLIFAASNIATYVYNFATGV
jgi:type IV secretory pathway VirB2 component (pilin)